MAEQVPEEVKSDRLRRLQGAIDREYAKFREGCVGQTFEVLFERRGRYAGQLAGRSPYLLPVQVIAPESMIGDVAEVAISGVSANSLFGALAGARARAEPAMADAES
jgi:tRNA-2-methylthio-N6-dimethylallyladenosine synthase